MSLSVCFRQKAKSTMEPVYDLERQQVYIILYCLQNQMLLSADYLLLAAPNTHVFSVTFTFTPILQHQPRRSFLECHLRLIIVSV